MYINIYIYTILYSKKILDCCQDFDCDFDISACCNVLRGLGRGVISPGGWNDRWQVVSSSPLI